MILLASTSPTRRALLKSAGIDFKTVPCTYQEDAAKAQLQTITAEKLSRVLAEGKALATSAEYPDDIIIAADQVLEFGNKIYSKAPTLTDARRQLLELRGHQHRLHTSVICARNSRSIFAHTTISSLKMRDFSELFLDQYILSQGTDILESVGNYKLEGEGLQLFETIEGDYFSILGLPLLPLLKFLRLQEVIPS